MPAGRAYLSAAGPHWRKADRGSSLLVTPIYGVAEEGEAGSSRFSCVALLWVALLLPAMTTAAEAVGDRIVRFDISRQRADKALIEFAEQADVTFIFPVDEARKVTANAVRGEFAPQVAIALLLEGTGLQPRVRADGALTVNAVQDSAEKGESMKKRGLWASIIAVLATSAATDVKADQDFDSTKLEEIIVTAQKREERLQDVPMSITAITADEISRRGLTNAADYLRGIPGVNQVDAPFGQSIVIRGLETSPAFQNFSAGGTTVATYFGETPTTNSSGLAGGTSIDLKLVDIERVEVLRGPQGTAFGSSSLGGVVRTIPVAPKLDRYEGKAVIGYSSTSGFGGDNYNIQGIGNLPLIQDKLAVRAAVYQYEDSGFYRNRAASDVAFQTAIVAPNGVSAIAVDEDEVGATQVRGGRVLALFQASDNLKLTVSYLAQKNETDGYALQNASGGYEQTILQVAPEHIVRGHRGSGLFDTDIDIVNAVIEYDLGWAGILAMYSHLEGDSTFVQPGTQNGLTSLFPPRSGLGESEHRENVGELRLATQLDGAWNFLAGLYTESLDDDYRADALWQGVTTPPPFGSPALLGLQTQEREQKQKAAFGEASWKFLPGFTLTGGVRAYEFDRTQHRITSGVFFGTNNTLRSIDASGTTFRGNLSYKPHDEALVYAGWSQGFRLGQPQPGISALCDVNPTDGIVDGTNVTVESTREIESDTVDSYELGGKFALLGGRLTIAADIYRIDWMDLPVRLLPPCGSAYTDNAGSARSEGVEVQVNLQLTRAFRLDVGGSALRAELAEDALGFAPPAFEGNRLPGSPKVNANLGLQYDFGIGGHNAFVRADSIYIGHFYGNLQEAANTRAGGYVKVDATARMVINNLSIDLFVRNLTNADDFTFRDTTPLPIYGYRLRPRTIGLQLGYTF